MSFDVNRDIRKAVQDANVMDVTEEELMEESIKKVIIFFAKLIYRLNTQGKIYLSNKERTSIEYLRNGDFEAFNREDW